MTTLISVIIPCLNEERFLQSCLQSIQRQTLDRHAWELIVVDNGSTDGSQSIAHQFADKVIVADHRPVGAVRNVGANEAVGELLVFLDADCVIDPHWLERAYQLYRNYPSAAMGGAAALPTPAVWVEKHWLLETRNGPSLPKDLVGCSIVIPAQLFRKIGGFNKRLVSGEDSDFSLRLKASDIPVMMVEELNVVHMGNAKTLREFINRQIWHAQSYHHKGTTNLKDPVFLIVVCFWALWLLGVLFFAFGYYFTASLLLTSSLCMPTVLTIKRFVRAKHCPARFSAAISAWILDLAYLTGRGIGLIVKNGR